MERVTERERGKIHEITAALVKDHACRFVVEDLKIPNMVKNHNLARSIVEQQWGYFVHCLTYKAASAVGRQGRSPQYDAGVLGLWQYAARQTGAKTEDVSLLRLWYGLGPRHQRGRQYPSQRNDR